MASAIASAADRCPPPVSEKSTTMRRGSGMRFVLMHVHLETTGDIPTRQKNPTTAAQAFEADVGPQADDDPVRASARMRLAQPQHVIHPQVGQHGDQPSENRI